MGVHVGTRPSGHPPTPHAADNQPQEPLLAHPVEAAGTVRRAALGLSASTDYSVLRGAWNGKPYSVRYFI